MHPILPSAMSAIGLGAAGVGYAALIERNLFTLRRFELPVLPPGARPVRIVQLTDMHLVPWQRRKVTWVRELARLQPDLVVNTGDNIAHLDAVPAALRALEPLMELPGVFAMGSNDYFAPRLKSPTRYLRTDPRAPMEDYTRLPTEKLTAGFTEAGWRDLNNARSTMSLSGLRVEFVGVDDPHLDYDRYDEVAGPRAPESDVFLGVMHAPYTRVLDAMARDRVDAIIAGHTHGGQLCLPFYGALVTNCDLDTRRAKGVSRWWPGANGIPSANAPADATWLHVSAGLGTSPYGPVRFACRPEASLLTLLPRQD
ncbi:MAG: metallophosphoesterase [Tetrasphaera sp.]